MKTESSSAISVSYYNITWYHIPVDTNYRQTPRYNDNSPDVYFGFYFVVYLKTIAEC